MLLACTATGSPQPTITWTKDSFPLDISGPRYTALADGLRIEQLRKSDEGKYECIATNSKGIVYSRGFRVYAIDLKKPPTFSVTPTNKTVDPETDVTLRCAANGAPQPTLVWRREGERVLGNPDLSLTIRNIKVSWRYTCTAFNQWGTIHTSAYVTVRALPFSPTEPLATKISPHAITVEWQGSGGPAVVSYKLDYRKKGHAVWFEVNIRGRMSWTVDKLQPYEKYEFRVFALNNLGTSKPSPVAEFATSQKAPGSAPYNIISRGASDTSFRAKWAPPKIPNGSIRGYRLYYTTNMNDDPRTWRFSASADNRTVVRRLASRTTYYIRILAYNKAGNGPLSDWLAVKTQKGVPSQPRNVRVQVKSSTAIMATWEQPLYIGDGIFGYDIYYNKSSKDMDTNVAAIDTFNKNIMGLRPFTYYKIGVAAKSDKGVGPVSFSVIARTQEDGILALINNTLP